MNLRRPPDLATLRAARWAHAALRAARAALAEGQFRAVELPDPPGLPASAIRGVEALLRRRKHSCLEGALVRQRWLAAHGEFRDVAIGVTPPSQGFYAHAWLVGDGNALAGSFSEITRVKP
jgi:hypothetical protein